jgi:hypothetical protein
MPSSPEYRRGKPLCVRIDEDAKILLKAMIPGHMGHGRLLSELIRKEAERRTNRPKMLAIPAAEGIEQGGG